MRANKRSKTDFVFAKNKLVVLSNNGMTARQKKASPACIVASSGVSEGCTTWKVTIQKECGACLNVGVVANKGQIDPEQHMDNITRHVLFCYNGFLESNGKLEPSELKIPPEGIPEGGEVFCRLNMEEKKLLFSLDGQAWAKGFDLREGETYFPYFHIFGNDIEITLTKLD